ncbi:MAG TPA: DNA-binding response regulator, partial [Dokdonella sp.]
MANTIRVMLVDDHAVVRVGFRMLLSASADIEVIAEADSGELAYQRY